MEKLKIIIGGFIGLYPTGGVTWDYIQYPLGLHLLGHDVYYIEDTMQYSTYQAEGERWDDATRSVQYLKDTMEKFGLGDRWAYRDVGSGKCYGLSETQLAELCETADVFINVSASTFLRDEYAQIPKKVLIDSDPMFTQVQDWDDSNPGYSEQYIRKQYEWYDYLFTFGENIGASDCKVPMLGLEWITTRQPICLDYWNTHNGAGHPKALFSTVMNWSTRKDLLYAGERWSQKNAEFGKIMRVPLLYPSADFKVVMAASKEFAAALQRESITAKGWQLQSPQHVISNADDYKNFIYHSSAEFSVAKNAYVKSNCGWFSCRSACYLAAGRPVVTQETGWSKTIEAGRGLFAFSDTDSALDSIDQVCADWPAHSKAARELAEEYFDSKGVLTSLIDAIN